MPRGESGSGGKRSRKARAARPGGREGDVRDPAVLVRQVDGAPVGEPRDGELGHALERLAVIEARGEQLAGLGEEALAQLGLFGLVTSSTMLTAYVRPPSSSALALVSSQ